MSARRRFTEEFNGIPAEQRLVGDDQTAKLKRLEAELRRVTEERDILKKAAAYFAKESG
ncbi:MAG: hypothetical protein RLZZ601_412 [Pseudomonadota bacterium]